MNFHRLACGEKILLEDKLFGTKLKNKTKTNKQTKTKNKTKPNKKQKQTKKKKQKQNININISVYKKKTFGTLTFQNRDRCRINTFLKNNIGLCTL